MQSPRPAHCVFVFVACAALAAAQTTVPVAVKSNGLSVFVGQSWFDDVSADGRFVVLDSSSALVDDDTNSYHDVYLHDCATGATSRLSVGAGGVQVQGTSHFAAISGDASRVAFVSFALGLEASDTSLSSDVFVLDRASGVMQIANRTSSGVQGTSGIFQPVSISHDGRYVAFCTSAALEASDSNSVIDVWVRDLGSQTTQRVSVDANGGDANGPSFVTWQAISDDGRYVVFESLASDLVANDTNGVADVFLRDRVAGTTERVNLNAAGTELFSAVDGLPSASISGNGRVVAFTSSVTGVVPPGDAFSFEDVYVRDLNAATTTKISVGIGGAEANAASIGAALSFDGRWIAFASYATNVVAGATPMQNVYRLDRVTGAYQQIDRSTGGQAGVGGYDMIERALAITPDGRFVGFSSSASNLVPMTVHPDSAYLHDTGLVAPVSRYCAAKLNSLGCTPGIGAASFASVAGNDAFFVSAFGVRNRKSGLLFWGPNAASIPFGGGTLCVAPPFVRMSISNSGGNVAPVNDCSGTYSTHFSQAYMSAQGVGAGQQLNAQYWSRDPGFVAPNNIGLTDAITFDVLP